ncbi:MAG: hypothetical protein F6K57_21375 [Moorea sp. SIO4A5]|nr:hypothetical protein [Moorena sp. SIO4A5]
MGGMGILVEWASCPFHFRRAVSTRRSEVENQGEPLGGALRGGLSQHWRSVLNMTASPPLTHPTRFPIPDSRFPIPYSLLPTPYSL